MAPWSRWASSPCGDEAEVFLSDTRAISISHPNQAPRGEDLAALRVRVQCMQVAELKAEAAALADEVALLRRAETHQRDTLRREFEDRHRVAVREHELDMGTQIKVHAGAEPGSRTLDSQGFNNQADCICKLSVRASFTSIKWQSE